MAGTRKRHGVAPLLSLSPMLTLLVCPSVDANECPDEPVQCSEGQVMKVSSCSSCALNGNKYDSVGEPCTCTGSKGECALPSTLCHDADNGAGTSCSSGILVRKLKAKAAAPTFRAGSWTPTEELLVELDLISPLP